MKLVGKIRDYYDSALSLGIDNTLYFHRETKTENSDVAKDIVKILDDKLGGGNYVKQQSNNYRSQWQRADHLIDVSINIIGFCGRLYPGIMLHYSDYRTPEHKECFYKLDGYNRFETTFSGFTPNFFKNHFKRYISRYGHHSSVADRMNLAIDALWKYKNDKWFIDLDTPYFRVSWAGQEVIVETCPVLKEYNFYKVKDPYQAFQEISMYLGGVIPRHVPEMINISDKDRIAQHGFNKLSFRHPFK